jgi:hypothetical protein
MAIIKNLAALPPWNNNGSHLVKHSVGPKAGLDAEMQRNKFHPPGIDLRLSDRWSLFRINNVINCSRTRCWWRSWLRHCATSQKVAGSILDGVIGSFHWHNPPGRTMVLGLTQPLTEMSTRNNSWGVKAAGAYSWQPYQLHVPIVLKSGSLNLLEPYGPVQACNGIALPFFN